MKNQESRIKMKADIKRLFEILTRQFLKAFLSQRPQNAPPFPESALQNPQILLSDYPETSLTFRIFYLISCPATLKPATMTPDTRSARVPPILHSNHPILRGNHPILHGNHPILCGNHPRKKLQGVMVAGESVDSWRFVIDRKQEVAATALRSRIDFFPPPG